VNSPPRVVGFREKSHCSIILRRILMKSLLPLFGRLSCILVAIVGASSWCFAQPANDSCAGATVIPSLPYHTTENTRLATPDSTDPIILCNNGLGGDGKAVWFKWAADTTSWIRFSTIGSAPDSFDTVIGLYTGTCGSLTEVACNDDSVSGTIRQSVMYYLVQKGTTYTLLVAEWNGGGGSGGHPTGGDLVLDVQVSPAHVLPPIALGPKTGSVPSGVIVSTNNLPPSIGEAIGRAAEERDEMPPLRLLHPPKHPHPPLQPKGSHYFEEQEVQSTLSTISHPVVVESFSGFDNNGVFPPDPIDAAGPMHVMAQVNSSFRVWDKSGNMLKTIDLNTWYQHAMPNTGFSDCSVVYDHYSHRWVMAGLMITSANTCYLALAVSHDSSALGNWYMWGLPGWKLGDSAVTTNFTDHPHIGFDDQALYITTREFGTAGFYSRIRIIGKAQLYNNTAGPVTYSDFWDMRDPEFLDVHPDFVKPAITYGSPGGEFFVNASPFTIGTYLTVWRITNPLGSPSISANNISVYQYEGAPGPSQPGGGTTFEDIAPGGIAHKPIYRDSSLFMVHSVASGTGGAYSAVEYIRINPFTRTTLEDMSMGKEGFWHFYPAMTADSAHNIYITYTRTGINEYAGAFLSGRKATDPPGLSPSVPLKRGVAHYELLQSGTRNRWGDYMGFALDPSEPGTAWAHTEYAEGRDQWGTWVGKVKLSPLPGRILYADPLSNNFGLFEAGLGGDTASFAVSNSGLDTLVISAISVTDTNFVLVNPPSLPLKVATNEVDSIKVAFLPKLAGSFNDSLNITSNDGTNPVTSINLIGTCFSVVRAQQGILYAGAGSDGAGEILTLNASSGLATPLGSSGFPEVIGLRVRPSDHLIIGLSSSGAGQILVRVNSNGGDAHLLVAVPFPITAKAMAFRGDTLYAADMTGKIYRVDVNTGTPTQVASTGLYIAGLDFNPITGVLWASVRGGTFVDGIYKVNLSTGTPTLVGRTGLNKATQDIVFDATGSLFGLAGSQSGSGNNSLIAIDTLTGTGTVLGATGYSSVVCLAMDPSTAFIPSAYHFAANWNLISIPLIVQSYLRPNLFPFALSSVFAYEGRYIARDTLARGRGYWLKVGSARAFDYEGFALDTLDTIGVRQKWNMVGSLSVPLPVSKISSTPPNIIVSNFLRYSKDTGYIPASILQPGAGYWVKVDTNGQLIFSPSVILPMQSPLEKSLEVLRAMNMLTIRDGNGTAQTLYFGTVGEGAPPLDRFELPPAAPKGMLDARFGTNTIAAYYTDKSGKASEIPIMIQAASFPVTLQWHIEHDLQLKYSIMFTKQKSSQSMSQVMRGDGTMRLTGDEVSNLRLRVEGNVLPTQFALGQNYPNPFNPTTKIHYELPKDALVKLVVYDVLGREVATVVDGRQSAGVYDATFFAPNFASGVYFYRLHAEGVDRSGSQQSFQSVRKMLLLR
jgi:hypothetical protein